MKTALILGGHGFIGHHTARKLRDSGYWVRTVDIKKFPYGDLKSDVDDYVIGDLRDINICKRMVKSHLGGGFDEVYQFSAFMGGAGIIFTGNSDAQIMHDSALLNINIARACSKIRPNKIFFSSSACVYNQLNQGVTDHPITEESSAYPAWPDSPYGWEKIFSEILWDSYARNYDLDIRIARFHNIFGTEGAWGNGREKVPAAICRKIAETSNGDIIEVWGKGDQTRSFLYIDECLNGIRRLMDSDFHGPVNIGSDEMVSINSLVEMIKDIAGKPDISIKHIDGPIGVRGRNSDNRLIREKLGWAPDYPLVEGLKKTYPWIKEQVDIGKEDYPWSN